MALFNAGDIIPTGTVTLTMAVPDENWFKRALVGALFLLAETGNWDNVQGSISPDECVNLAVQMIDSMEWEP